MSSNMPGRRLGDDGLLILTDQQNEFLAWLTGERPEGESQAAFAARVGVSEQTLRRWKKDDSFLRRWEARMRETHAHPDTLARQLDVLNKQALTGNIKAIELYWKLVDRMTPDRVEHVDSTSVAELSDEQLDELFNKAVREEKDRRLRAVE